MEFLKRWIKGIINEHLHQPVEPHRPRLGDMFMDAGAAIVAFKIDNGYVVRVHNSQAVMAGVPSGGFTYCADHQAIADYIVTAAMKDRLGVQTTLDLSHKYPAAQTGRTSSKSGLSVSTTPY